jgi:hypothetical protein
MASLFEGIYLPLVSRVAQSVYCLATGWTTGRFRFDPRHRRKDFSCNLCVQTTLGPTQPPVQSVQRSFPRGVTPTIHSHLVPRSRMSRSYTYSPPSAFVACSGTIQLLRSPLLHRHRELSTVGLVTLHCRAILTASLLQDFAQRKCSSVNEDNSTKMYTSNI